MKCDWWETNTAHGILIILANIFVGCLIWYKNDLWIYWSAIYIYVGTWIYHFAVENKNSDIECLTRRINQLENTPNGLKKNWNIFKNHPKNDHTQEATAMKKIICLISAFILILAMSIYAEYEGSGYSDEYGVEYDYGYEDGYDYGYETGYNDGHINGYYEGRDDGYDNGYDDGYKERIEEAAAEREKEYEALLNCILAIGVFVLLVKFIKSFKKD